MVESVRRSFFEEIHIFLFYKKIERSGRVGEKISFGLESFKQIPIFAKRNVRVDDGCHCVHIVLFVSQSECR